MSGAVKHDAGKQRWSLLPEGTLWHVLEVLEFGARKYAADQWQKVPDARRRYYDAAMRHIDAWESGEQRDEESDLHHLAHAVCCLLFLMWFDEADGKATCRPWGVAAPPVEKP